MVRVTVTSNIAAITRETVDKETDGSFHWGYFWNGIKCLTWV